MKSIDVKSLLIGFLLCTIGFLTIGATGSRGIPGGIGKYQIAMATGQYVYETIINTETGSVVKRRKLTEFEYKDRRGQN